MFFLTQMTEVVIISNQKIYMTKSCILEFKESITNLKCKKFNYDFCCRFLPGLASKSSYEKTFKNNSFVYINCLCISNKRHNSGSIKIYLG